LGEIKRPVKSNDIKEFTQEWYGNFIEGGDGKVALTQEQLCKLMLAGNFMLIQPIIELCAATLVARYIQGKKRYKII